MFRYAVVTGRAERDPTVELRGAIAAVAARNRPAIFDSHRIAAYTRVPHEMGELHVVTLLARRSLSSKISLLLPGLEEDRIEARHGAHHQLKGSLHLELSETCVGSERN